MTDIVHYLLSLEIATISWLQHTFESIYLLEPFYYINFFGDPRYCFVILAPLGYIISRKLGETVLIMASLAEHCNTILKWLTFGHRPYWWAQAFIEEENRPPIQQRHLTCETGPGMPSGHVMVSMVTYSVLVGYIVSHSSFKQSNKKFVYGTFITGICLVAMARLLLAAHFIHQVFFGSVVGICLIRLANSPRFVDITRSKTILTSLLVFATGALIYALLWLSGFEPTWTENYAVKYCLKREWVRMDTSTLQGGRKRLPKRFFTLCCTISTC